MENNLIPAVFLSSRNSTIDDLKIADITDVLNAFLHFLVELLAIPVMTQFCMLILICGVFFLFLRLFKWR